jgi:glycosyltransferase involved in cell wall biosynthesis
LLEPKDYESGLLKGRGKKFRQAWSAWRAVKQKLQANEYDIVECYGDEFWLVLWQLSKSTHRPLLVAHTNGLELLDRSRSDTYDPIRSRFRKTFNNQTHARFSRFAFSCADAFVSLCELDRQHVLEAKLYPTERTAVVEPGLDDEYLDVPFMPHREERVAFIGSWIPRKGIKHLSMVMSSVLTYKLSLQLDLYGTGTSKANVLRSFPARLHSRINVHPRISNRELSNSLARTKVFFFPSQYEGFGIALAEAMACGCAAVTTRTGFGAGLRDHEEAWLCSFDDVRMMENAIRQFLENDSLRAKVAMGGWRRARALTWEVNISKLENTYIEWLANHDPDKENALPLPGENPS